MERRSFPIERVLRRSRWANWTGLSLPSALPRRKELDQPPNLSFTPSTTCVVVLFKVSQVLSPAFRTVFNPARAAVDRFRARLLAPAARALDFLPPRLDEALRADFFLADDVFVVRFFLIAMSVPR
jgi:hypothetical protein